MKITPSLLLIATLTLLSLKSTSERRLSALEILLQPGELALVSIMMTTSLMHSKVQRPFNSPKSRRESTSLMKMVKLLELYNSKEVVEVVEEEEEEDGEEDEEEMVKEEEEEVEDS